MSTTDAATRHHSSDAQWASTRQHGGGLHPHTNNSSQVLLLALSHRAQR